MILSRPVPFSLAAALLLLALPARALAQPQAELTVSFEVPIECRIQSGTLQFLAAAYRDGVDLDTTTNIQVSCLRNENFVIAFHGPTVREIINQLNPFSKLRYSLLAGKGVLLGDGGGTLSTLAFKLPRKPKPSSEPFLAGITINLPVTARLFAGQQGLIVSGDYIDVVTMTLSL